MMAMLMRMALSTSGLSIELQECAQHNSNHFCDSWMVYASESTGRDMYSRAHGELLDKYLKDRNTTFCQHILEIRIVWIDADFQYTDGRIIYSKRLTLITAMPCFPLGHYSSGLYTLLDPFPPVPFYLCRFSEHDSGCPDTATTVGDVSSPGNWFGEQIRDGTR